MEEEVSSTVVADIAFACRNINAGESTDEDRLKSIVNSVRDNDEIGLLNHADLSNCTPQTKKVAEKNRAISPSVLEDTNEGNENSSGYAAPYSLVMLIAITISFASTYSRNNNDMTNNKANYLWPFYLFLCGAVDIGFPTFFPSCNATNWGDNNSGSANYLDGCLYTVLKQAMPLAMLKIITGVLSYPAAFVDTIFLEFYVCGYVDGDGSYSGRYDGSTSANCSLSIKRKQLPIPFVGLLTRDLGCIASDKGVVQQLNRITLYDSFWFIANQLCATIKRLQVVQLIHTAAATQLASEDSITNQTVTACRIVQTNLLSAANNLHGHQFSLEYYNLRFGTMITGPRPLAFFVSSAGMIAADGGVGYDKLKCCRLYQACEDYCHAFATATQQAFEFDETPTVRQSNVNQSSASANTRGTFAVGFNVWQSVLCILYFGAFDYRRRCQWLVFLLAVLIRAAPDFPTKTNVIEFLEDLIIVIRKDELS